MHKLKSIFFLVAYFLLSNGSYLAQGCSQCKAQIESSNGGDLTVGNGINIGITILMISPYVLLLIVFRKRLVSFYKNFTGMWKTKAKS